MDFDQREQFICLVTLTGIGWLGNEAMLDLPGYEQCEELRGYW